MPLNTTEFESCAAALNKTVLKDDKKKAELLGSIAEQVCELLKDPNEVLSLVQYIDLTTLAGDDTKKRVEELVNKALLPYQADGNVHCGAVCVYPARVADVVGHLKSLGKTLPVASVAAGFPSGQYHLQSRLMEIELTVADGATEIDIVINRCAAIEGNWNVVYDELVAMKEKCGKAHMKSILATGELKSMDNVVKASVAALLANSDFIKTSTGKESVNATLLVAYTMCLAIKQHFEMTGKRVGFKPAGGIRTTQEALGYRVVVEKVLGKEWLTPELFRIGASSLLDDVLKTHQAMLA
ncbi:hypothetical protein L596_002240 [Steinernema carpocapsae]|uniref:deoxyribose-phosphate aldolase n=1 Tax=Steinernema carpocapsae TaxID=34508 RepID=A0A4V6I7M8_STECR|nr:hypothetical protein L596_002240 [Steinernema carpocapsae]